jgi:hypothetical protein
MRFFGYVCLLALALAAWGIHAGWFTFARSDREGTTSFTIDVHRDEFARDLDAYEERVHAFVQAIDRRIASWRDRSRSANAKSRTELEWQIEAEEKRKAEAQELLRDLKNSPPEAVPDKKKQLDEVLEERPASPEGGAPRRDDSR